MAAASRRSGMAMVQPMDGDCHRKNMEETGDVPWIFCGFLRENSIVAVVRCGVNRFCSCSRHIRTCWRDDLLFHDFESKRRKIGSFNFYPRPKTMNNHLRASDHAEDSKMSTLTSLGWRPPSGGEGPNEDRIFSGSLSQSSASCVHPDVKIVLPSSHIER